MGANSNKVLHVDTRNFPIYDTEDLDLLSENTRMILSRNDASGGSLSVSEKEYLKEQLAAAIFRSARAGERDYARLKRSAIDAVAVPSSDPGF